MRCVAAPPVPLRRNDLLFAGAESFRRLMLAEMTNGVYTGGR